MKFLHTADWHTGKTLKGRDRLEEQRAVLGEIVRIAEKQQVDAVLIAGDVYDSTAPSAQAQQLVVKTLLGLRQAGAEVIAIAGNHDHGPTFEAYRPLMREVGITVTGAARAPDRGGVIRFRARSTGEDVQLAVLPFLTPRYAVRAAEIMTQTPAENVRAYDDQIRRLVDALTGGFAGDTVNLAMSHMTCIGGVCGGGERAAQSIFEYSVPASIFPVSAHYVALGHLHRRQTLPAHCPVHYSGSPIAVDFGEQDNTSTVCLVEASPSTPAARHRHPGDLRTAAAHGPRHRSGARGDGRDVRRRLPAGLGAGAGPGRAARDGRRHPAERPRGPHRPRVRRPGPGRARGDGRLRRIQDPWAAVRRLLRLRRRGGRQGRDAVLRAARRSHRRDGQLRGEVRCVRSCWT